jgi:hypothetical protein
MKLFRIWLMEAKMSKNAVSILHWLLARHTTAAQRSGTTTESPRTACFITEFNSAVYRLPI